MTIRGRIDGGALLAAAMLAGVSGNPVETDRVISRMINIMIPPKETDPPPTPGPNPKKSPRGPWDKGFRPDRRRR